MIEYFISFIASVFIVLITHELSHDLAGRFVKLKNKLFGLAVFGAFVAVPLENATRKQKTFVYLAGPIFPLIFIGIPVYYLINFSGIALPSVLYNFLNIFLMVLLFVNIYNLVPLFKELDMFNVVALYTKHTKEISIISNILFLSFMFYYTFFIIKLPISLSLISLVLITVPTILLARTFERHPLKVDDKIKGLHWLSPKLGFYYVFG